MEGSYCWEEPRHNEVAQVQGPWGKGAPREEMARGRPKVLETVGKKGGKKEFAKGATKGKGKSKGESQFYRPCYYCGEQGHSQNGCPRKESAHEGHQKGKRWGKTSDLVPKVGKGMEEDNPGPGCPESNPHRQC